MAQTPEDEWFPGDGSASPKTRNQPGEDDWLVARERPRRTATFDMSTLTSPHSLALVGVVVIAIVALVAAAVALSDSRPSSAVLIPLRTAPLPARALPRPTTTTAPAQSVPTPTTTLKPGDSGPQVKILQRELKALGYSIAAIDGSYGPQTSRAVAAFQRASHLAADGIVGAKTLQALSP